MHRLVGVPLCALLLALALSATATGADWRPATYANPDTEYADHAAFGAAGDGTLTGLWFGQSENPPGALMSASRPAGGPWATTSALSVPGEWDDWQLGAPDITPQIAVNAAGDSVAVWIVRNISGSVRYHVKAAYRPAGAAWGDVQLLESNGNGRLQAGIAEDGSAWVGWAASLPDTTQYAIETARVSADGAFAAPQTAAIGHPSEVELFDLAVDPSDGEAALVVGWTDTAGFQRQQVRLTRHAAGVGSAWATPSPITDFPAADANYSGDSEPQAAFEADGDLRVAWLRTQQTGGSVHSMLLPPGSDRTTEDEVAALSLDEYVSGLDLATNGQDTVLAWVSDTFDPQGARVRTAELPGGATDWAARNAASGLTFDGQSGSPVVAIGTAGETIVAWVAPHDETLIWTQQRDVVWSVQRPAGEAWSAAARLPEPPDGVYGIFPRVAVTSDGHFHAIWNEERPEVDERVNRGVAYTTTQPLPPDTAGPGVTITTPAIGQRFTQGADATAAYACTDETMLVSCAGTVANGAPLDTSSVGQHSFTVTAIDGAGHQEVRTHGYFVDAAEEPRVEEPAPLVPQAPLGYHEIRPQAPAQPAQRTSEQLARLRFDTPAMGAVKGAPKQVKGSQLMNGKVSLPVKPTTPNVEVRGGFVMAPGRLISDNGLGLISDNGLGLISDNGLGLLGAAGGNLLGPAGANLIGPAGGNLLGAAGGNLIGAAGGNLARAAAPRRPKLTVVARGSRFFATPKAGKLRLKPSRAGRAALRGAFRKRGKQNVKVLYVIGFTERGSDLPTVVTGRQITVRE